MVDVAVIVVTRIFLFFFGLPEEGFIKTSAHYDTNGCLKAILLFNVHLNMDWFVIVHELAHFPP